MADISKIKALDGVTYNVKDSSARGSLPLYGTCTTAKATAAKVATLTNADSFSLSTGTTVRIKFTDTNTGANPTLNVNGTGAKPIMRYGTTAASTSAATSWTAGAVVPLTYDGTNWIIHSGWDNNTTYSNMSQAEATAGTATSARSISAKVLNDTIAEKAAVKRELTKAEYDALSDAEKNNGTIYLISDEDGGFPLDTEVLQGSSHAVTGGAVYDFNSYSTEEKVVGKWIDGKPIYRKVIVLSSSFDITINAWNNVVDVSSLSIDALLDLKTLTHDNFVWRNYFMRVLDGKIWVYQNVDSWSVKTVVIEYTKTTD